MSEGGMPLWQVFNSSCDRAADPVAVCNQMFKPRLVYPHLSQRAHCHVEHDGCVGGFSASAARYAFLLLQYAMLGLSDPLDHIRQLVSAARHPHVPKANQTTRG